MRLKVKGIEFSYGSIPILKDVCMELERSEMLAIVGPNGVGKSTLIRCIDMILTPNKGKILLDGQELKKMNRIDVAKKIGYVSQNASQSFPATVYDTILIGRRPHLGWRSSSDDNEKILDVLELLGIEDLAMNDFNDLSGGQQQKVMIARALAQEAEILLFDEPTSNLDIRHQLEVMEIVENLILERGMSAIMAVHDLNLGSRYANKMIMMYNGGIYRAGDPSSVLTVDNIKNVYGVEVELNNRDGRPYIIPIKTCNKILSHSSI
jgi:iron complex transport system ATP-binding protein